MGIEEILPNLYRIKVSFSGNPLGSTNAYVVKGKRNLIIDTGINNERSERALRDGLETLGVDLEKTDFFLTHLHADHMGLVSKLVTETSKVYFNQPDREIISDKEHLNKVYAFYRENGFPEEELERAIEEHPGRNYYAEGKLNYTILKDGDKINIGDYNFECVSTPGHSPGHMCLYEPDKKILISGDHILGGITPNISQSYQDENLLEKYLESLDMVYKLSVKLVLPGHRKTIKKCRKRIRQLKRHHKKRLKSAKIILKHGPMDAYQVAKEMEWNLDYETWDEFSAMNKFFATGEAMAHLEYLVNKGRLIRESKEGKTVYGLPVH